MLLCFVGCCSTWLFTAASQTLKSEGPGGLYRGFGPALARSFPANGACFLVYEIVSSALKAYTGEQADIMSTEIGR
jgi:hypothetical protein